MKGAGTSCRYSEKKNLGYTSYQTSKQTSRGLNNSLGEKNESGKNRAAFIWSQKGEDPIKAETDRFDYIKF